MAKRKQCFVPKDKEEKLNFLAQLDEKEDGKYQGKRNSYKRNFENIYLRSNILRRAMTELPPEKVRAIMADSDFQNLTRHVAVRVFNRYRDFLLVYGFESADLISMARVFGINFYTSKYEAKTKKDENYLMIRYVWQRFHRFIDWTIKKFGAPMPVRPRAEMIGEDEDENGQLYDDVSYREWSYTLEDDGQINGIMINMDKPRLNSLRQKFNSEWHKHIDSLAHYATTAYAPEDVRRKARAFCRKHGIDYVKWAKTKIDQGKMSEHDVEWK